MNERIKIIRKTKGLTQADFGKRIGLTRDTIANIEGNRSEIRDVFIKAICREFHVNESWLRDGIGEMYSESPDGHADRLIKEYGLDDFAAKFVREYCTLTESEKEAVRKFVASLSESQGTSSEEAEWEDEKARRVREYSDFLDEEKRREPPRSGSRGSGEGCGEDEGIA